MLSNMKKAFRWGRQAGKAGRILQKTYDLPVEDTFTLSRLERIAREFADLGYDEHAVAVHFLGYVVRDFDSSNEHHKEKAIKFISRAKGAYSRGLLTDDGPLNHLFDNFKNVFDIDVDNIQAAKLDISQGPLL